MTKHEWEPTAKALCSCGESPSGYSLPTDLAQWGIWEVWHREHLEGSVEQMTVIVIARAGDTATHYDDSYRTGVVTRFTTVGVFLMIDGEEVGPFSRTDYTYTREGDI